jgi:hypothetical protein
MRLEGKIAGKISALLRLLGKIIDLLISVGDVTNNSHPLTWDARSTLASGNAGCVCGVCVTVCEECGGGSVDNMTVKENENKIAALEAQVASMAGNIETLVNHLTPSVPPTKTPAAKAKSPTPKNKPNGFMKYMSETKAARNKLKAHKKAGRLPRTLNGSLYTLKQAVAAGMVTKAGNIRKGHKVSVEAPAMSFDEFKAWVAANPVEAQALRASL